MAAGCRRRPMRQARCHVDTTTRSQNQLHRLVPTHQVLELDAVEPSLIVSSAANGVID
jgi:hypothetical protein